MLTLAYCTVNARMINIIHIRRVVCFWVYFIISPLPGFFFLGGGGKGRGRLFSNVKKKSQWTNTLLYYFTQLFAFKMSIQYQIIHSTHLLIFFNRKTFLLSFWEHTGTWYVTWSVCKSTKHRLRVRITGVWCIKMSIGDPKHWKQSQFWGDKRQIVTSFVLCWNFHTYRILSSW